jgi:hypothetical protein
MYIDKLSASDNISHFGLRTLVKARSGSKPPSLGFDNPVCSVGASFRLGVRSFLLSGLNPHRVTTQKSPRWKRWLLNLCATPGRSDTSVSGNLRFRNAAIERHVPSPRAVGSLRARHSPRPRRMAKAPTPTPRRSQLRPRPQSNPHRHHLHIPRELPREQLILPIKSSH